MLFINKIVIAGNLGRAPQIGATPKGTRVAKFSVAVEVSQKGRQPKTTWVPCLALNDWAEFMDKNVNPGDPLYIEGSLDTYDSYPKHLKTKVPAFRLMVDQIKVLPRHGAKKEPLQNSLAGLKAQTTRQEAPLSFDFFSTKQ